jgi:hypothetical protein
MSGWSWLTDAKTQYTRRFVVRVVVKAVLLFALANVLFALLDPLPALGQWSLYNRLVPGRLRLPYGEDSSVSYNLSLFNLNAMFASHVIAVPTSPEEYRIALIGDSSTWGFLLQPEDTLAANINARNYTLADGRHVRAYNLGYPVMSLTKDLMVIDQTVRFQPDLIVWLVTLESFPPDQQLFPPLVQHNADMLRPLIAAYNLHIDPNDSRLVTPSFPDRTIVGQRRALADLLRLQLYGFAWASTGIDQSIPDTYTPRQEDFEPDATWHDFDTPQPLDESDLAFDVLAAGVARADDTPMLLVNEPTFISAGRNSEIRYNFFYPRWAYDEYRPLLAQFADERGVPYLDLWDAIPPTEFTDSAVHMTPAGTRHLATLIAPEIIRIANVPP